MDLQKEDFQDVFNKLIHGGKAIVGNKCYIDVPLEGEIDLTTLKNKNLEEIHFPKGRISRIMNVPVGMKKIIINDNMLDELPVQRDLVHLEANNNRLTKADLREMISLVSLFLNNNRIQKIDNLPSSLHTLNIDQNELDDLDLSNAPNCRNVSCKNNPVLYQIVGGKQISSPDFILNKDAQAQIRLGGGGPKKRIIAKENILYPDVKQAVNEYYQLKNRYEESKKDVIKKIMSDDKGSRKEKIKKVRNAVFKCINCGRDGGSIFVKENMNFLTAVCGNTKNPCNLNITIVSSLGHLDYEIQYYKKETEMAKQKIIQTKMNTLFGYIKEETSVEIFKQHMETIKKNNTYYGRNFVENSYYEMQNDPKKTSIISRKMADVHEKLAEIRRNMEEYANTGNKKILEAVAQKQKHIHDAMNVIRSIKYPIHEMVKETDYNLVDDEGNFIDESKAPKMVLNVLKQYPYNFDDYLNPNLEELIVQKYVTNEKVASESEISSMGKYFDPSTSSSSSPSASASASE